MSDCFEEDPPPKPSASRGETRPTFEELKQMEKLRREILLRVSCDKIDPPPTGAENN